MTHKGTQTIQTRRLLLRPAEAGDAPAMFHNWASDPEVTKYLTWPTHESPDITARVLGSWIEDYEQTDYYQWLIVPKDLGEPIGSMGVVALAEDCAEVGYCIGRPWWHRGYTSEALAAVIAYLLEQVGLQRVIAKHDENNPHSGLVMRKCGMVLTGTEPGHNNQGDCTVACYAIPDPHRLPDARTH